ncbi:zinc-finger homeodomain protein 6-like [Malus domestica]|uniref:zinc-finger homeodomain protein 6-like n=1 Tax=Malus domestica TaxID=3750 RepID=UPI003976DC41
MKPRSEYQPLISSKMKPCFLLQLHKRCLYSKGWSSSTSSFVYRECLRNHAAILGSYATDGCDEFILDHTSPGSIQCVAYGCHRNFHCRVTYAATSSQAAEDGRSGHHQNHVIMSCSGRGRDLAKNIITQDQFIDYNVGEGGLPDSGERMSSGKKQFRTKFTAEQKEKMLAFAKKLGWKLLRKDLEDEIERLCKSVGLFTVLSSDVEDSSCSQSIATSTTQPLSSTLLVVPEFQPEQLQVVLSIPPVNLHPMQTRSKSGIIKKIALLATVHEHEGVDLTQVEPATYKSALKTPVWHEAMKDEIAALHN